MKIYGCPAECAWEEPDYTHYDYRAEQQRQHEHQERLRAWLIAEGNPGPYTGEIVSFGVADGRAQYMFADNGRKSYLIHLPYGDAYQYRGLEHFPRKAVVEEIERQRKAQAFWASHGKDKA